MFYYSKLKTGIKFVKKRVNDIADNLLYFARGYLIHNLDAYTFHIAVFAIEAEGKETYFPETR